MNKYLEKISSFVFPSPKALLREALHKPALPPRSGTMAAVKHDARPEQAQVVHKTEASDSLWDKHQRRNSDNPGGMV